VRALSGMNFGNTSNIATMRRAIWGAGFDVSAHLPDSLQNARHTTSDAP